MPAPLDPAIEKIMVQLMTERIMPQGLRKDASYGLGTVISPKPLNVLLGFVGVLP